MPETLTLPKPLAGRYAIERELGGGLGMAAYVARDRRDGQRVVLKLLHREFVAGPGGYGFLVHVELLAHLDHPNILRVLHWGRLGGDGGDEAIYCVVPYVEGESLRQRLEREPQLPLDAALRIAGGVAAGLQFAHERGHAHRALKPENVLLQHDEPLVDFAVGDRYAAVPNGHAADPEAVARAAAYVSPEVVHARPADGRADQYSLAVVLYEMLAGQPPFVGPTAHAVLTRILTEPAARLAARRVVPRVVERAVHRALSKSPAERFATIADFAAALHGASAAPQTDHPPAPAQPRRRWRAAAVATLAAATAVVGLAVASRAVAGRRPAAPAAHNQLTFAGTATAPALSPDGRALLYVAGGRSLVLQPLDGGDSVALIHSARSITVARWTGDGRAIVVAMTRDSTGRPATFLVPAGGGVVPRKVLDDVRPFDTGRDSTAIVRAARDAAGIDVVSLATGATTRTIALTGPVGTVGEVDWSPDGRWIAFTMARNGALWTVAAEGGLPNRVAGGVQTIRWASGSDALYFLRGPAGNVDLVRVGIDSRLGRPTGTPVRVTSLLAADQFDVGRDGRVVHRQTNRGAQVRTFVLGGAGRTRQVADEQPLAERAARLDGASVSPDGRWVAYSAARGSERDVHVVAFGGGSARIVAASPAREDAPAWSPDGSRLTFAQEDSSGRRIMLADAQSGSGRRIGSLPATGSLGAAARWSASGRHVAYYAQDLRRIVLVNLQRQRESVIRLPENVGTGDAFVVLSPNGTQLIASTRVGPEGESALWLVFGNGRRWRRIDGPFGESFPIAWHRNGWIYLVRNRALATGHGAVHLELWRMRGPDGRPELYAPLPEGCGLSVTISADASRGVCNYVRVESDLYVASGLGAAGR